MSYLSMFQAQLGIPTWLFVAIIIWSVVWKLLAFWKSARKNHVVWFIIFAIVNTVGILEILYIYIFSESNKNKSSKAKRTSSPKKRKSRR